MRTSAAPTSVIRSRLSAPWSLSYDANGNLIGKTNVADAGDATRYTWDSRYRLIALDAPGLAARFEYDPLGRRIARTVNGQTTAYLYDGAQAIGEIRGAQTTTVLTGVAMDEALARYAGSGRLEQLTDHLGSVIRRIGEDGSTRSRTAYSPYGESSTEGDAQGDGTGYTGREDDGTGLYFYRARYYDPVLGRFVSEDPIGVAGGLNVYAYVGGSPVQYVDPLGYARQGGKTGQWWEYTDRNFQRWYHKCVKQPGDPDATRAELTDAYAQWVEWGKPDGKNGCGGPPPPPAPAETCGDTCQKTATVVVSGGVAYVVYRCLRMLPSLFPALWPTIPANAAIP